MTLFGHSGTPARLIPKILTIDPYDRHLCGFWLGAIGAVVRVPQADRNDIQKPQKSGLRWPIIWVNSQDLWYKSFGMVPSPVVQARVAAQTINAVTSTPDRSMGVNHIFRSAAGRGFPLSPKD
jgi:hypothetical protein